MSLHKVILIITLTLAFSKFGKCQCISVNLIKNPSLEDFLCCPTNLSMIYCAKNWYQPLIESTSDYFNTCAVDSIAHPQIRPLYLHAYFNDGYAGIICNSFTNPFIYREYLQGELSEQLLPGTCYYAQFWTLLSGFNSTVAIDAISMFFSDTLPKEEYNAVPFYYVSQINNNKIIKDTINWSKISGVFYASGGERYFTIGTFMQEGEINKYKFKPDIADNSYYFFDNFSLCPCEDTIPPAEPEAVVYIPNIFSPNGDGQNNVFRVRGENIETLHLAVYNRWGNKVFEGSEPQAAWDGTYNGKPCADGVYYYMAEIGFAGGKQEMRKGNVTLVR